jgi:ribosome recycling factor
MSIQEETQKKMQQALDFLKAELKGIRTGKANPALLDSIRVDVYGSKMAIKDVASISCPEPRQLLVTPFDRSNVGAISKAIEQAELGVRPIAEADKVRIPIPPMDEAVRKKMAKACHDKCEEVKIRIRDARRAGNDEAKKQKDSGLSEDEIKVLEKKIQTLTDDFCKQAEEISKAKEKEISTI